VLPADQISGSTFVVGTVPGPPPQRQQEAYRARS
jgi:hypothetical protein